MTIIVTSSYSDHCLISLFLPYPFNNLIDRIFSFAPSVSHLVISHGIMASTQPGSGIQTSTIIVATIGTLTAAALGYAAYFDYKRRSDPNFRRSLKRQQKQIHKAAKEEAVAAEKGQKEAIRAAVDEANDEGFPKDPEKTEEYFMTEVARGEQMCQDGESTVPISNAIF